MFTLARPPASRLALSLLGLAFPVLLTACGGGGGRDVEKLLADIMSDSPRARARAESHLAEHGRALIKSLSSLVTGEDVEKLELRGDWKALRAPAARALAIMAEKASLARSEAEVAAKPLLAVLHGNDRDLRIEAAKALGSFAQLSAPANDLILVLREDDAELCDAAADALARNALRSIGRLVLPEEPAAATVARKDWERLVSRLASTDDDIRLETVRDLAASGDARAGPLLLDRLAKDKSSEVRYAALRACLADPRAQGETPFAKDLSAQLAATFPKDDDSRVVLVAARALRTPRPEPVGRFLQRAEAATRKCVQELLAVARNPERRYDDATRSDALAALRNVPDDQREERDQLLAQLLSPGGGESARLRRAAASVLATSEAPVAAEALQAAMQDADSTVKLVAAQALGRERGNLDAVHYLIDLLSHKEAKIRTPAADALGTLGTKALEVLVSELKKSLDHAGELAQWEVPLEALRRKPELSSEERGERARLERAVAACQSQAPGRDEKQTAWGIVTGLGQIADQIGPEASPALDAVIRAAAQCHYADVRRAAVNALASFRGEKAIEALAEALNDPDETVRWYGATSLEKQGDPAVPALTAALGAPATAAIAATSLARIGSAGVLKLLLDRLDSAKGDAKVAIIWSLGELLRRRPDSPQAPAARRALAAAGQLTDEPEAARLARYALSRIRPATDEKK